jgi:hypothetical protein
VAGKKPIVAGEAAAEDEDPPIIGCNRGWPFPFVDGVARDMQGEVLAESGAKYNASMGENEGEWQRLNGLFPPFWSFCQAEGPYWGGPKTKKGSARYNTLGRGIVVPEDAALGGVSTNLKGVALDMCAGLHDLFAWADLEKFLVPCGATHIMWRQTVDYDRNPGSEGNMLAFFKSEGTKYAALFGWWSVGEEWAYRWAEKDLVERCKDYPNEAFTLNKFKYGAEEEKPKYWYNVPGAADGRKFIPVDAQTPNEARVNGWDTLQTTKGKGRAGFMTNLSFIMHNREHPTNEWLCKVSIPDPAHKGQTMECPIIYAPTRELIENWCDAASLKTVKDKKEYKFFDFSSGGIVPVGGDCMLSAMMLNPSLSADTKSLAEAAPHLREPNRFPAGIGAIRDVLNNGRQVVLTVKMAGSRSGGCKPDGDGFFVFRVAPRGGNGWMYHAVACTVVGGVKTWAEPVDGAYEGYRVTVANRNKRRVTRKKKTKGFPGRICARTDVILADGQEKAVLLKRKGYADMIELPNGKRSQLLAHAARTIDAGGFTQFA